MPTRFTHAKVLPSGQTVFDPRGVVTSQPRPLAARVATLAGLRLGVLDNSKWNASKLLRQVVAQLEARHELAKVTFYTKQSFSRTAPSDLIAQIAAENQAVVTAVGD